MIKVLNCNAVKEFTYNPQQSGLGVPLEMTMAL